MSATKASDIATSTWDGDTDATHETNAMTDTPGFPVELAGGGLVNIVGKKREGQGDETLVDDAGNEYQLNQQGRAVELDEVDIEGGAERLPTEPSMTAEEHAAAVAELNRKIADGEVTPEEAAAESDAIAEAVTGAPATEPDAVATMIAQYKAGEISIEEMGSIAATIDEAAPGSGATEAALAALEEPKEAQS